MEECVILAASHLGDFYHAIYGIACWRLMMQQSFTRTNAWLIGNWTLRGRIQWNDNYRNFLLSEYILKYHLSCVNEGALSRPEYGNSANRILLCERCEWYCTNEWIYSRVCYIFLRYTWVDWWLCCSQNMVLTCGILFFPDSWAELWISLVQ